MSRWDSHITPSQEYIGFLFFLKDLMRRKDCISYKDFLFRDDLLTDFFSNASLPTGATSQESYNWICLNLETRKQLSSIITLPDNKLNSLIIDKCSTKPCDDPLEKPIQFNSISLKIYFSDKNEKNFKEFELSEYKSYPYTLVNFIRLYSSAYPQVEDPRPRENENITPSKARQLLSDCLSRNEIYYTLWDELRKTEDSAFYYDEGQYFPIQKTMWDDKKNYLTLLLTGHIKKPSGEGSVPVFIVKEITSKFTNAPLPGQLDKLCEEVKQFFNFPPGAHSLTPQEILYFLYKDIYGGNIDPNHNVDKALRYLIRQYNFVLLQTKGRSSQKLLKELIANDPSELYILETDLNNIEGLLRPSARKANKKTK